ncbi:kinesin-like protein KIF23 isoform X2 [Clavelina lepadiformis]|uniref:kinesin-like protein KIF23 isoform X2 n=1 Tax=Clavelina lepadiformis TaxID=159417 RepID=UPI004042F2C5
MRPQRTPMKPARKPGSRYHSTPTDPVEVCARIRNLTNRDESSCIEVVNNHMFRLVSPDGRVTECQFSHLFNAKVGQKLLFESVAQPMIGDLIKGKSGLLFTYGVTSSGKTYTMTGTVEEPGLLPRCLDMIFNSISSLQASKYVFMPDNMNGFIVQSEADALLEKQEREIMFPLTTTKTPSKNRTKTPDVRYDLEHCISENIDPDCRYAVFVSYVEIYNDYIYDLLGDVQLDAFNRPKPPQSKRLREDKKKNMFVYGVTEIEVKSTEEAFAAFHQGQERRRIAHTHLNAESSRSHSILNIRLVQAPLDPLGEDLLQEKSLIGVSQLSLVDLAGSERMGRTGAGGERLREAGNINSSLMTLRRCLEQLRENQKNGLSEMVKYRNSKLTHLFKSYFEGRGKVKMIVCLNPNVQDFDENLHVVQFAEVAQQVEVARQEEYKIDRADLKRKALDAKFKAEEEKKRQLTAVRQLSSEAASHRLFTRARGRKTPSVTSDATESDTCTPGFTDDADTDWEGIDLNIGGSFPNIEIADAMDTETVPHLIRFLSNRIALVNSLKSSAYSLGSMFRSNLQSSKQSDRDLQSRLKDCEAQLSIRSKDAAKMERQVKKLESKNQVLTKTTQIFEKDKKQLQEQLNDAELQLKNSQMENKKTESKLRGAVANTRSQIEKQCDKRVRNMQSEMQEKMWVKEERLRQLKNIISDGREGRPTTRRPATPLSSTSSNVSSQTPRLAHKRRSRSAENLLSERKTLNKSRHISSSDYDLRQPTKKKSSTSATPLEPAPPIAPKHRRSCSANNSNWLAHLPSTTVPTETILQPCIKPNRVVNVPSPKDVAGAHKYLLTHQSEDRDGEIQTQLVKGEVFHTRTGGQQVQFVDIETLKQQDPKKKKKVSSPRKRKSDEEISSGEQSSWTDVETRCAYGIGSTGNKPPTSKRKK